MLNSPTKKPLIIVLLIIIGFVLQVTDVLDAEQLFLLAQQHRDKPWLIIVLILLQALMFTFALAGSLFLWVVAPLYPPLLSAFILAAGGCLGGIGAYLFSRTLSTDWIKKIENSHTYKVLQQNDNFFTLFALRVFPAFPHSFVNYSSGILKVKLSHFIAAAILGIAIKSYIYSKVIYNAATSASIDELLSFSTFGPLILISLVTLMGVYIKYRLTKNNKQ